jgi:hypothetical protein
LPKRKEAKEKGTLWPTAPQAKGIAIRCYPSAIFNYMVLVFLAYYLQL